MTIIIRNPGRAAYAPPSPWFLGSPLADAETSRLLRMDNPLDIHQMFL